MLFSYSIDLSNISEQFYVFRQTVNGLGLFSVLLFDIEGLYLLQNSNILPLYKILLMCIIKILKALPGLPIPNDQLSLATADGHQTVHGLDASLHGLPHRDTRDDARSLQANSSTLLSAKRTLERKKKSNYDKPPNYSIKYVN